MKTLFLIFFLILCLGQRSLSQDTDSLPIVGNPMPFFELNHVTHYAKNQVSNNDFKGKWLILDFWFTGCKACIKNFPKTSQLQALFKDKIQFVTVGLNDQKYNSGIEKLYEGLREKMKLDLVSAYDSVLFKKWKIYAMPYVIIVNPEGVVYAITDGRDMDRANIQEMLEGKRVNFYNDAPQHFSNNKFDTTRNVLFQSTLTRWQFGDHPRFFKRLDVRPKYESTVGCKVNRASLKKLYLFAFTGSIAIVPSDPLYANFYPIPVLEISDTTLFDNDYDTGKNMFNYLLRIARDSIDSLTLLKMVRDDLHRIFGFTTYVEEREMPVWKLVSKPGARLRLKTKGEKFFFSEKSGSGGAAGFKARNFPLSNFLQTIMRYISDDGIPYFDETGITENINIRISALMIDRNQVIRALRENGLDLVMGKRKMKVVVIGD